MRVAVATLGCKVNQYDTAVMERLFGERGWTSVPFTQPADAYVVNSCTVTDRADSEARRLARRARRTNPNGRVILTGCYAQTSPEQITRLGYVDYVIGLNRLPELLRAVAGELVERTAVSDLRHARTVDTLGIETLFVPATEGLGSPPERLREAVAGAVARLDPESKDPALRRMVLVGHSQGGLLVKMQSISSGDRIWNAASKKPLEEMQLSDQTRDLLRRGMFVEPVPGVSRVVFICTPHRGSFVAGRNIIANVTRKMLSLPFTMAGVAADLARNPGAMSSMVIPSAVDNMSPRHHFIRTLQEIPVAPSVTVNSIIAVEGDGPVEEGDDGVVKYTSAHIEPVESELVVKSNHSTQGNPHTIEEVRRILRLHEGLRPGAGSPPSR